MGQDSLNNISDNAKASFSKEMEKLINSERYEKIVKLTSELPNDMDLGKAIRQFISNN